MKNRIPSICNAVSGSGLWKWSLEPKTGEASWRSVPFSLHNAPPDAQALLLTIQKAALISF
jgi:hypothetical protein